MFNKRHQNRFLLFKIIKQKKNLIIYSYSRYRNSDPPKKCRIISADNNCFEYISFDKLYNVFSFENVYKY